MTSTARTLTIYRERYTIEDDGHGGSDAIETETITENYLCAGTRVPGFTETPAREAVGYLRSSFLSYGADGGDWFGQVEPSVIDYRTGEEERVTGHLSGFTAGEERAIIRMMAWLDARDEERRAAYLSRAH